MEDQQFIFSNEHSVSINISPIKTIAECMFGIARIPSAAKMIGVLRDLPSTSDKTPIVRNDDAIYYVDHQTKEHWAVGGVVRKAIDEGMHDTVMVENILPIIFRTSLAFTLMFYDTDVRRPNIKVNTYPHSEHLYEYMEKNPDLLMGEHIFYIKTSSMKGYKKFSFVAENMEKHFRRFTYTITSVDTGSNKRKEAFQIRFK